MKPVSAMQMAAFFFSFFGRTTRREYIMGMAIIILVQTAIVLPILPRNIEAVLDSLPAGTELTEDMALDVVTTAVNITVGQVWVPAILITIMTVVIAARRFQDFGVHGLAAVLLLIPIVNILAMLALAIIPGTAGPNRYGPQVRYV